MKLRWKLEIPSWAPFLFFAALLAARLADPPALVFDEVHYIPAARALAEFRADENAHHPPLAKLIGAVSVAALGPLFGADSLIPVRLASAAFGLWLLWGLYRWMRRLGFSAPASQAAVWLTGFNFLWFVQSKVFMLETFFAAFGIWGTLEIFRGRSIRGWLLLGAAVACKWSALPYLAVGIWLELSRREPRGLLRIARGLGLSSVVYAASFLPAHPGRFADFFSLHAEMWRGHLSLANANHPYSSRFWTWPLLIRPMWYHFENVLGGTRSVFAGGNPALFWGALPAMGAAIYLGWLKPLFRERRVPGMAASGTASFDSTAFNPAAFNPAAVIALQFLASYLFWAVSPRSTQYFYYYFNPSLWLGPAAVLAMERLHSKLPFRMRPFALPGYVALCGALFLHFLPILDGRIIPDGSFMSYMWFQSWI
ncbi:MAG: hypothetical protein HYW49_08695 [Deltaproteobacteria bacterium]|nr:hypothetical protein [Deltaproteobacteria bacterium]